MPTNSPQSPPEGLLNRIHPLILVFIGGGTGSLLRVLVPLNISIVNTLGALLLGVLTALWAASPRDTRGQRLLLGTGLLGGFTSYSAIAGVLNYGPLFTTFGARTPVELFFVITLLSGLLAAAAGVFIGNLLARALPGFTPVRPGAEAEGEN